MKLLLDAQLPLASCRWFEERGHEAIHAQDLPDPPVTDDFIVALAEREGLVVVSKDENSPPAQTQPLSTAVAPLREHYQPRASCLAR